MMKDARSKIADYVRDYAASEHIEQGNVAIFFDMKSKYDSKWDRYQVVATFLKHDNNDIIVFSDGELFKGQECVQNITITPLDVVLLFFDDIVV